MARPYDLPAMSALVCFEASARKLSFKEAAAELNVTPAAVSHQIKRLEQDLGSALFRRQHRGVDLTEAGAYLFIALQRGFEGISDAVRDIRSPAQAEDVLVQATTAVSAFWLTPQITAFWKVRPDVSISQMVSDSVATNGRSDLCIHYGPMPKDDPDCVTLFRDDIIAIGSPGFARERNIRSIDDLRAVPLIHVVAEDTDWTGWAEWFSHFDRPAPAGRGIVVNNHMIALQLAREGAGAVLGWTGLIGPMLDSGTYIPLAEQRMPSPHPFYLETRADASPQASAFRDWLIAQR